MKRIKAKLPFAAVAVLAAPILAFAYLTNPGNACSHAPVWVIAAINAVLASLGLPPICS